MQTTQSAEQTYQELKMVCEQLALPVREEATASIRCGLFALRGKEQIFVNIAEPAPDRVDLLVSILKKRDIGAIFIKPYLRELLE